MFPFYMTLQQHWLFCGVLARGDGSWARGPLCKEEICEEKSFQFDSAFTDKSRAASVPALCGQKLSSCVAQAGGSSEAALRPGFVRGESPHPATPPGQGAPATRPRSLPGCFAQLRGGEMCRQLSPAWAPA